MIEIIRCSEINKGSVICSFAIRLPKMKNFCIHNMTLFQKDLKRWITFPSNKIEKDGKTKYLPHCGFECHPLNEEFKKEILIALDSYMASKKGIEINNMEQKLPKQERFPF